jgi:hypothetical protein
VVNARLNFIAQKNVKFMIGQTSINIFVQIYQFQKRLPKEKSVYAYLLQANEPSIKIIKIELNLESVPYYDGKKCLMPNYKPFFEKTGCRLVPTNPLVEPVRNLPNTLEFVYADNFQFNGSQPNKCINAIGAMLVMKIKDVDVENFGMGPHTYIDMEMNDLKDVRDWLLWYGSAHSDRFAEKRKQEISSLFPGFTFMNMS